jgi:glycosyltransferase involved in cell wall biosynthesis
VAINSISFSIIIATFNRGHLILNAIRSILDQHGVEIELIVVDDGGTDNTGEIISRLKDPRILYIRTDNHERGAARNAGFRQSKGDYVNFFDSDDIYNPCLSSLEKYITDNGQPPVICGSVELVSEKKESLGKPRTPYKDFKRNLIHNNFLACGSVFIRRNIAAGFLFSEDRRLSGAEDWELWLRIYSSYDFLDSGITIFKQLQHPQRSLHENNSQKEIEREIAFLEHISKASGTLQKRFASKEIDLLMADRYTFIALSQVRTCDKKAALASLAKAFKTSSGVLGRKRFWAVIKKIVWQ